jgi:hypothetical protein
MSQKSPTGVWVVERQVGEASTFGDQVSAILNMVSSDREAWKRLSGRFRTELIIGVVLTELNQGFSVPAATIQELASRGLKLSLDLHVVEDKRLTT